MLKDFPAQQWSLEDISFLQTALLNTRAHASQWPCVAAELSSNPGHCWRRPSLQLEGQIHLSKQSTVVSEKLGTQMSFKDTFKD